ncbi:MAG: ATP synthase F1 subunit gamma [Acidobacteriota bacterium]
MANRRAIVKRRKAVRNIKKITRTMQLIATARFQAAMNRAIATRPYTDKLAELVADLSGVAEDFRHPLLETSSASAGRSALISLTSNRGLCGGYNANIVRLSLSHIDQRAAEGETVEPYVVGNKGASAFRFRRREVHKVINDVDDKPRFDQVEPLAQELIERFVAGELSSVHVAYTRFYSAGRQEAELIQLLPLVQETSGEGESEEASTKGSYEIRPSAEELLNKLLPASVRMRLFQSFNDAAVSEQIARMAAMKAATEAADEMIGNLTREYNRARQSQITLELLDIVGGANALA